MAADNAMVTFSIPLPKTQKAVLVQDSQHVFSTSAPVPYLDPQKVMIKVQAIAINPVDAKMVELHGPSMSGCVAGYDFAGVIIAFGAEAELSCQQLSVLRLGDRVAGLVLGCNPLQPQVGAFCEYLPADPRFLLKLPDSVTFEEGATLGVAIAAAGMVLYQSLGLQMPVGTATQDATALRPLQTEKEYVLVIGGSTACGTMTIQLLKEIITTASNGKLSLVRSYGAHSVIDHRESTCVRDIRAETGDTLRTVIDCVSNNESFKLSYEVIGAAGGRYIGLNPFPVTLHTRSDVTPHWVFILPMFGQPICVKGPFNRPKPRIKDVEFETAWFEHAQILLDQGRIRPHPVRLEHTGLEGVPAGINLIRRGKVSGEKLVYTIA